MIHVKGRHIKASSPNISNWSRENLAWAAALFEGEGCFSTNTNGTSPKRYAVMRMTSTDRDVLERFQEIVGCGAVSPAKISPASAARGTYKQPYKWQMGGRLNVYALGIAFFQWLGARRKSRFKELIEVMKTGERPWQPANAAIARNQ